MSARPKPREDLVFISGESTGLPTAHAKAGGASRDRTGDLKLAKLALSQLSYGPVAHANVPNVRTREQFRSLQWWAE